MSLRILFILACLIGFISCKPSVKQADDIITVTIEPQRYFLEKIVGDKFIVNTVVPMGSNPESFDLSPAQILTVNKSKAYFKVGFLGIENTWIKNISETNKRLVMVDCSAGVSFIDDHKHEHDHEHDDKHETHNYAHTGGLDPHTWSSPATALKMVENMYNAVIRIDSLNREFYTANYRKLTDEIKNTDTIIRSYLSKSPNKAFVIYHPALSYFAREYSLEQLTVENEGKNPSPLYLKTLIDKAKADNVKAVFIQQEFDPKNTETVAKAIGVQSIPINLMTYNWSDEMIKIARAIAGEHE